MSCLLRCPRCASARLTLPLLVEYFISRFGKQRPISNRPLPVVVGSVRSGEVGFQKFPSRLHVHLIDPLSRFFQLFEGRKLLAGIGFTPQSLVYHAKLIVGG